MTLYEKSADELATQLMISPRAISEALRRGLVSFEKHRGVACWRFGDTRNGCLRRLDGQPFDINGLCVKAEAETKGEAWHRLIGLDDALANDRHEILLTPEGSKDALAALHLADTEARLPDVGVVAALGSAVKLIPDDIEKLRERRVRIFGDADAAGKDAESRIAQQLVPVASEVQIFDLHGLNRDDGASVKDLFDLTRIGYDDFENNRDLWNVTDLDSRGPRVRLVDRQSDCFSSLPSNHQFLVKNVQTNRQDDSPVTKDNQRSTNEYQGWREGKKGEISIEPLLGIADSMACYEKGKAHRLQFNLAREVRRFEKEHGRLSNDKLRRIHRCWFSASTSLPPGVMEVEAFGDFIDRLRKVRIIPGTTGDTLRLAKQRAQTLPLPEIPGFSDPPVSMRKIAALHRELQRASNGAPHFCTAEDARAFGELKHKIEAHRIQLRLADDRLGVLRCVKRGHPHKGGKPTLWLYLLPIPPVREIFPE
jgi:hypothetical protein